MKFLYVYFEWYIIKSISKSLIKHLEFSCDVTQFRV